MHWRYMTLAIKQKCFRIVLITRDFLYSVIFAYAHILQAPHFGKVPDFIWSNESKQLHFENGRMSVVFSSQILKL